VKIPAIELFSEMGKLFDKELKTLVSGKQKQQDGSNASQNQQINKNIQQHLIIEDHHLMSIPRDVQLKIGAFLTNLMCKTLKYNIGNKSYLLLKAQTLKIQQQKFMGYIMFNKSFIETFIGELDKIHDLNLQMERSLPMIY